MATRTLYDPAAYDPAPVASYWEATAPADDPAWAPLEGDAACDVAVIGGGYTGLSAALHLARDHGIDVRVLEAGGRIGWGASGRNGGFCCMPAGKMSVVQMVRRFGEDETRRYLTAQADGIAFTRSLIEANSIDCEVCGDGHIHVAHRPAAMAGLRDEVAAMTRLTGIRSTVYSREEFREAGHDSTEQFGATKFHAGFALHPMRFAQGLARAAARAGAVLHPGSAVMRWLKDGDGHLLHTGRGVLRAKRVIVAANGYGRERLHRAFDARILPALSNIIVTRPLTAAELAAQSWVTDCPLNNARNLLFYYRKLPDDRILLGARGDLTGRPEDGAAMRAWMEKRFAELFPNWRDVAIEYFWRGLICMSRRRAPSAGRLDDDPTVFYGFAYHGTGVNTAPWTGCRLAAMAAGAEAPEDFPAIMRGLPARFPFPGLRLRYLAAAYRWYGMIDG